VCVHESLAPVFSLPVAAAAAAAMLYVANDDYVIDVNAAIVQKHRQRTQRVAQSVSPLVQSVRV